MHPTPGFRYAESEDAVETAAIIASLARAQHGVFAVSSTALSRQQLRTCFDNGWIERVLPGIARVSAAPRTHQQAIAASLLWGGHGTVAAGRSAAGLWGVDDVRPAKPEIWLPRDKRHEDVSVIRSGGDRRATRRRRSGLWVCSPEWMLRDLLRTETAERIECTFEHLRRERFATVASLERNLAEWTSRTERRRSELCDLMRELRGTHPCESELEVRVARILRRERFERPHRQVAVGAYRIDFAWPRHKVALECFGRKWHEDPAAWKRDLQRLNALGAATGYTILFATWEDTKNPTHLLQQIATAMAVRAA
jgi:very-short-patch-repair endonuclease